jgi:site-specific recombinase
MSEIEPNWRRTTAIWWLINWRNVVGSLVIGAIFGTSAYLTGRPLATMLLSIRVVAVVAAVLWTAYVVRSALRKKYRGFRIALLPLS